MNEDFVPYELAKKLKEKGFKEKCIAAYDIEDGEFGFNNYVISLAYKMNVTAKDCLRLFNNTNIGRIDAPTISQVLKWLREEKKIFLSVDISRMGWFYVISPITTEDGKEICREYEVDNKDFSDYNSAAIAGIEYVIDNLI